MQNASQVDSANTIQQYVIDLNKKFTEIIAALRADNKRFCVQQLALRIQYLQRMCSYLDVTLVCDTLTRQSLLQLNQQIDRLKAISNEFKASVGTFFDVNRVGKYAPYAQHLANFDDTMRNAFNVLKSAFPGVFENTNGQELLVSANPQQLAKFDEALQNARSLYSADDWDKSGKDACDYTLIAWKDLRAYSTQTSMSVVSKLRAILQEIEGIQIDAQKLHVYKRFIDPDRNNTPSVSTMNDFFFNTWADKAFKEYLLTGNTQDNENPMMQSVVNAQAHAQERLRLKFIKISPYEQKQQLLGHVLTFRSTGIELANSEAFLNPRRVEDDARTTCFGRKTQLINNLMEFTDGQVSRRQFQIIHKPPSSFCIVCTSTTNPTGILLGDKDRFLFKNCLVNFGQEYCVLVKNIRVSDVQQSSPMKPQAPQRPNPASIGQTQSAPNVQPRGGYQPPSITDINVPGNGQDTGTIRRPIRPRPVQPNQAPAPEAQKYKPNPSSEKITDEKDSDDEVPTERVRRGGRLHAGASNSSDDQSTKTIPLKKLMFQQNSAPAASAPVANAQMNDHPTITIKLNQRNNQAQAQPASGLSVIPENAEPEDVADPESQAMIELEVITLEDDPVERDRIVKNIIAPKASFKLNEVRNLPNKAIRIGSSKNCHLRVTDDRVKETELEIVFDDSVNNCWVVKNTSGSRENQFYIKNYERVQQRKPSEAYPLAIGDVINLFHFYQLEVVNN